MKHVSSCRRALARRSAALAAITLVFSVTGCGTAPEESAATLIPEAPTSFAAFLAQVYREPWENGVYIYNGDTPAMTIEELEEAWLEMVSAGALAVNRVGNNDDFWGAGQKLDLRYCVSDAFGARKAQVVAALNTAAADWEAVPQVDFRHVTAEDGRCDAANLGVVFDVRPVSGQPYLARAFFPSYPRATRNILIDATAFTSSMSLTGIMRHELGHTIGFRHEHTRPEARQCFENNAWRGLTPYDRGSIMHYPQCGGSNTTYAQLSADDKDGACMLYGSRAWGSPAAPAGCGRIDAGYGLGIGRAVTSCDGRFTFVMQGDGNLVLYQGGTALWSSNTWGKPGFGAYMQGDGNLVVYTCTGRPLWSSNTWGKPGAWLAVQNDGNVVIYHNGTAIWATNTCCR